MQAVAGAFPFEAASDSHGSAMIQMRSSVDSASGLGELNMIEPLEEREQKPSHKVKNLKANGLATGEKTKHESMDEGVSKPKTQDLVLTEDEDQEGSIEDQIEDEDQEVSNEDQRAEERLFSKGAVEGGAVEELGGFTAGGQAGNRSMMSGGRRRRYNVYYHFGITYQQAYSIRNWLNSNYRSKNKWASTGTLAHLNDQFPLYRWTVMEADDGHSWTSNSGGITIFFTTSGDSWALLAAGCLK